MSRKSPSPANENAVYRAIGENVRAARKAMGLTQEDVALSCGMTRTSLVNIEQGRQRTPIHTLIVIADAIGVPPALISPILPRMDDEAMTIALATATRTIRELQQRLDKIQSVAKGVE